MQEIELRAGETAFNLWFRFITAGVISLLPDEAHIRMAWKIATELGHPLQDCLYLAVSENLEADLVTADRKFVAAARRNYPLVRLLGA